MEGHWIRMGQPRCAFQQLRQSLFPLLLVREGKWQPKESGLIKEMISKQSFGKDPFCLSHISTGFVNWVRPSSIEYMKKWILASIFLLCLLLGGTPQQKHELLNN